MFRWEYERYIAWEIEEVKRHVYQREPHEPPLASLLASILQPNPADPWESTRDLEM